MSQVGTGKYTYELIQDYPQLPVGESFGQLSRVAVDSQDRLYVLQRKNPPVMIFDRDGKFLNSWGNGVFKNPHGLRIIDDVAYITDREDSVALVFTLDGKPLQILGKRGVHSDTGCDKAGALVPRAAGPFNYPTELVPGLSNDLFVTDGYRNCRVHKFTRDGQLVKSWGQPGTTAPGEFHLPHGAVVAPDGKLYVVDRENHRIQIFSSDGDFLSMWSTGKCGPNEIVRDKDGVFYICEQQETKAGGGAFVHGAPGFVSVRNGDDGTILARWASRPGHGMCIDSYGDLYLALPHGHHVDKYVRKN